MHRMKVLEFSCVLLATFNDGLIPFQLRPVSVADEDHLQAERCLAHVATTLARDVTVQVRC